MGALMEYGGVVGILVVLVVAAMVAVVVQGLLQSFMRNQPRKAGAQSRDEEDRGQPDLFSHEEFEAVALVREDKGFGFDRLADLMSDMALEASLNKQGFYTANRDDKLMFYLVNGFGAGRLDEAGGSTNRLVFILPFGQVQTPTRGFDLMMQAAVTVLRELGGVLKDNAGNNLSAQGIEHIRERVRSWEMQERRNPTAQ